MEKAEFNNLKYRYMQYLTIEKDIHIGSMYYDDLRELTKYEEILSHLDDTMNPKGNDTGADNMVKFTKDESAFCQKMKKIALVDVKKGLDMTFVNNIIDGGLEMFETACIDMMNNIENLSLEDVNKYDNEQSR